MSRPCTVTSATTKGLSGQMRRGWSDGGCSCPGDLSGCRVHGHPTAAAARRAWTRRESAAAIVPAGIRSDGKGQTSVRGTTGTDSRSVHRPRPSHPRGGPASRGRAVKPPRPGAERSADPASPEPTPHPARAEALWDVFLSRDNLARALRRVERNGGAPGPDGMTVDQLRPHLRAVWPEIRSKLDEGQPRPPGDDPQARGRGARAGRADGARSLPPAGVEPGPVAHLRAFVLGSERWLPAGPERPSGGPCRSAGGRGRADLGRRCRPRPVLRPGEPRRPDSPGGPTGRRPAGEIGQRPGSIDKPGHPRAVGPFDGVAASHRTFSRYVTCMRPTMGRGPRLFVPLSGPTP
jgi:hypothetical protein